jgi:error-prone DNA polymerase
VLQKTLGVPLFQEQAMRLAVVAAGFTPGEADQLRRAMGAWRKSGVIEQFRLKMLQGMRARGLSEEFAERLFNQLRGFGEYGFPESHAASFALLVYVSAWLKCHYPAAFAAALLNSQPMGFYAPAQLVRNARDHGVRVLPVDVNHSDWDCTLEESANAAADSAASSLALRLGFRMLAGMSRPSAERIVQARHEGPFVSVENLARRAALPQAAVEHLAAADALASLAGDRRTALWNALDQPARPEDLPLFADQQSDDPAPWALPAMSPAAEVAADYRTAGLSLRGHPLGFYRRQLDALGVAPAESLARREADRPASVAGLVLMRQRPSTAKGITFITLEDETGTANLVVRLNVWQRHYLVARRSSALVAWGTLERKGSVIHLVADRLADLTECLQQQRLPPRPPQEMWSHRSRDFR